MAHEAPPAVVIDIGSGFCKAGFSGEMEPSCILPTVIGNQKDQRTSRDAYFGNEAASKADALTLRYPVQRGEVTDWGDMEQVIQHMVCEELKAKAQEHAILVTEAALADKTNKEKLAQCLFEKMRMSAMYVGNQQVLSLFAAGKNSGMVLEVGHGLSSAVPVEEGRPVEVGILRQNLAGQDITEALHKMLPEDFEPAVSARDLVAINEIKEKVCYVAKNYQKELETCQGSTIFQCSDGRQVNIDSQKFRCAEALFQPSLYGLEAKGIHQLLYDSIMTCSPWSRPKLMSNIVLAGGTTLMPGIEDRLSSELAALEPAGNYKIKAPQTRKDLAWIGGSLFASLLLFKQLAVTRQEYEEKGVIALHK